MGSASGRSTCLVGGSHCLQPLQTWKRGLGIVLLTLGRERVCLDVIHGHNGPYLGAYVTSSIERAGAMPPNPYTLSYQTLPCSLEPISRIC